MEQSEQLLIFPCNGNGIEAVDCLSGGQALLGFIDDSPQKQAAGFRRWPVLGRDALARFPSARVLAVPGSPASYRERSKIIGSLGLGAERFARVVHSHAAVSPLSTIGCNFLAMAGVVVTSNAVIGDHVCLLPNTVVHHDVEIGDWTLVGANVSIAGGVVIAENCYIGSGTSIKNGIRIGAGALIGLGSNVIRDVPPGAVVAGNPARSMR